MNKLSPRTRLLVFAGMALAALLLLAATVSTLQFADGSPLPIFQMTPPVIETGMPDSLGKVILAAMRVVILLGWVALPFVIVLFIVNKEWRKRILRDLAVYLPILAGLYLLYSRRKSLKPEDGPAAQNLGGLLPTVDATSLVTPPAYTPPAQWVTTATTIGLALILALALGAVLLGLWRRRRSEEKPLRAIQEQAQAALDAIQLGGDLREVIMRCYLQMSEALRQYRNIQREQDMTPHEFEAYLERRGLPREPVRQLTLLFEQVRYGDLTPGRQDERAAISSLSAIVSACQRSRE